MRFIDGIEKIDKGQWEALLGVSGTRSFFQTRECYDFYAANAPLLEAFCFAVEEDNLLKGVIIGFIQKDGGRIKRFFSRRAIINGGPLLSEDISKEALTLLLTESRKALKRRAIYIETRNYQDFSQYGSIFESCGFFYEPHLNFHVDTSSEETMDKNLSKSRKRDIRVSLRDGAEIVETPSIEQVREFYGILDKLYKEKVKTPLYPLSFFEKLYQQKDSAFLLVRLNGKIIGGTVCVGLRGYALYEWFACGEDGVYKNIYPSTLATYAGISYAVRNGYLRFDMMGAGKPDESYGVREFKAKFGGELVEHGRFMSITKPLLYRIGTLAVRIMKSK